MTILYDLLLQNELNGWRQIKVLAVPLGIKFIEFNEKYSNKSYLAKLFWEVKICVTPDHTSSLENNIQAKRKQYG